MTAIRRELGSLPATRADRAGRAAGRAPARVRRSPAPGEAVLATWHQLIDLGSLTDGDEDLAGTARPPVVRLSKATASALGVADGDAVTVGTDRGALTLPAPDHRDAGRRGLAADQLARLDRAADAAASRPAPSSRSPAGPRRRRTVRPTAAQVRE